MIADLKPYPAMKETGVEWLGEVPEHWKVRQLGRIGRLSKGNGGTKEDEVADGVPCVRYGDLYTQHRFFIRNSRACVTEENAADYKAQLDGKEEEIERLTSELEQTRAERRDISSRIESLLEQIDAVGGT